MFKYSSNPKLNGYYIFPDYDLEKGISPAKIDTVTDVEWETCEIGNDSVCKFDFVRPKQNVRWFLVMPCGGTYTSVTLTSTTNNLPKKTIEVPFMDCPPYFELTQLNDGIYQAYMVACGLGGGIRVELKSK